MCATRLHLLKVYHLLILPHPGDQAAAWRPLRRHTQGPFRPQQKSCCLMEAETKLSIRKAIRPWITLSTVCHLLRMKSTPTFSVSISYLVVDRVSVDFSPSSGSLRSTSLTRLSASDWCPRVRSLIHICINIALLYLTPPLFFNYVKKITLSRI